MIARALFTRGSLVQALARETVILVAGRLIIGAGVGVAAVAAPLYAAELAPTSLRDRFVSAYQLAITVGIFLAYLVDGWLPTSDSWCLMLEASAVPGLLLFVVALVAPESPRWLMKMIRRADAATQIGKIRPCVACIDRLGRRKLLLAGLIGMGPAWRWSGPPSSSLQRPLSAPPPRAQADKVLSPCCASRLHHLLRLSMGPVTWTVINEIFPGHIRGRGVTVATAVNRGAAFLVSQSFLSLIDAVPVHGNQEASNAIRNDRPGNGWAERWPASSIQRFVFDKWSLCRLIL